MEALADDILRTPKGSLRPDMMCLADIAMYMEASGALVDLPNLDRGNGLLPDIHSQSRYDPDSAPRSHKKGANANAAKEKADQRAKRIADYGQWEFVLSDFIKELRSLSDGTYVKPSSSFVPSCMAPARTYQSSVHPNAPTVSSGAQHVSERRHTNHPIGVENWPG